MIGLGAWLPRRHTNLRNYGQILFGGGLAAVYFTTYAAHHIEPLRVIQSPLLDGLLLMGWAGFIVFLADRRKSELLALFALGLAYYTSVITRGGSFTLFSNLVLTVSAVGFLLRHRWATVSSLSLVATYAGYAYWRFNDTGVWNIPGERVRWLENSFLVCYWIAYTSAVFLCRAPRFAGISRATIMTANNGAYFALTILNSLPAYRESFWLFALLFGGVLLGMAALLRVTLSDDPISRNAALAQGLLLVTVGLVAKLSGHQLALVLGAEAVALVVMGSLLQNRLLTGASYAVAVLGATLGLETMTRFDTTSLTLGMAMAGFMGFGSWWVGRTPTREIAEDDTGARMAQPLAAGALVYALLAIGWVGVTTVLQTGRWMLAPALAIEALALTLLIQSVRARELTLMAQALLPAAFAAWFAGRVAWEAVPWWNPAVVVVSAVALAHWWQHQERLLLDEAAKRMFQWVAFAGSVLVLHEWLRPLCGVAPWAAASSGLVLGLTLYAVLTRSGPLLLTAQLFMISAAAHFVSALSGEPAHWHYALGPIAAAVILSLAASRWLRTRGDGAAEVAGMADGVRLLARGYGWSACGMAVLWVQDYIPQADRFWVFALVAWAPVLWFACRGGAEALVAGAVFTAAGAAPYLFAAPDRQAMYLPNLAAILLILGAQQLVRRREAAVGGIDPSVHAVWAGTGGVLLWAFISRTILAQTGGFYLTVGWSGLGFLMLAAGLLLQERAHRWLGLCILGCAIVRVGLFDVWKLATVYRILSFMALGVVLLVLGFIYNRYEDRIRKWL